MNLLLLESSDLEAPDLASIAISRYAARQDWWPPQPGRRLRVGLRDGLMGDGCVEAVDDTRVLIRFTVNRAPPPALPLVLLLALPRPKMLRRILRASAELGIKHIHLINATRVEKSFWQSPLLQADSLHRALREGLEQACDSMMPQLQLHPRLRPFVEDELPAIAQDSERILAHPGAAPMPNATRRRAVTLGIGPEGGFSAFELDLFQRAGFQPMSLGPRILRCETALPVCIATLFPGGGLCG